MLILSGAGLSRPTFGAAYFGGAGQVAALQNALKAYAQANGDLNANPGTTTDAMNDSTVVAALYVVWKVAGSVPALGTIKNQITSIPGVGSILNAIIGNPLGLIVAWGLAKSQAPAVAADIQKFIESNANAIAIGVSIAAGQGVGVDPGLPPSSGNSLQQVLHSGQLVRYVKTGTSTLVKLAAYDPKLGMYRVAIPKGLGAVAATHQEIAPAQTVPADAKLVQLPELEKAVGVKQWYQQPLVWVGIGVGVLGLGAGTYYLLK